MFKWMYEKAAKDAVEVVDKKVGPFRDILYNAEARRNAGIIISSLGIGFLISSFGMNKEVNQNG